MYEINFNVSYSLLSVFKSSPLQFYFDKIIKAESDTVCNESYGFAGNVLHETLAKYIESPTTTDVEATLLEKWRSRGMINRPGFNGSPLSHKDYLKCALKGKEIIDKLRNDGYTLEPEKYVTFKLEDGVTVKGYIDLVAQKNGECVVCDWKSDSTTKVEHADQRLFYAYLMWKKYGIIPSKLTWYYLKLGEEGVTKDLTEKDVQDVHQMVLDFIKKIREWGDDMSRYDVGEYDSPFNPHKKKCEKVQADRKNRIGENTVPYKLTLTNGYVFLQGYMTDLLLEGLDRQMRFDVKGKYFIQRNIQARNGGKRPENWDEIGRVHIFNKTYQRAPYGFLDRCKRIITQYCEYYLRKPATFEVVDLRDQNVLTSHVMMPTELQTDRVLRDYQLEAIESFLKNGFGFLQVATGGGKTLITAEIIRRLQTKTLWIIDRKELLFQTKLEFEKVLGMPIGIIGDGESDIKDVTVATIQTLAKDVAKYSQYLQSVNLAIVDESHHAAAESYQKVFAELKNTKYRLGTTATARRDDGNEQIMFGLIGDILYSIDAKTLEEKGHLMKPTIHFIQLHQPRITGLEYADVYTRAIVFNDFRNKKMVDIVKEHSGKKILVLTTRIEHGEKLTELLEKEGFGVFMLHGSVESELRKEKFQEFKDGKYNILIGTLSIFAEGIDLPDLSCVINMAANKAENKTVQILGRILRNKDGKTSAHYYDFIDNAQFLTVASKSRMKALREQGHDVELV